MRKSLTRGIFLLLCVLLALPSPAATKKEKENF